MNNTKEESLPRIKDSTRIGEIAGVVLTALLKILFMDVLNLRLVFILGTIAAWSAYLIYRARSCPAVLTYWGFRRDNLKKVFVLFLPFSVIAVVSFIVLGIFYDTINLSWHIIPVLVLYPFWGTVQQFLVIGLVAGNLNDLRSIVIPKTISVLLTAVLFSLVHFPHGWLMLGTFVLAVLYGSVYLREKNLFAMGLFHGWLGALFFYTVVNRDPFMEVFGKINH